MRRLPLGIFLALLLLLLAYGCGSPPTLTPERCTFPLQLACVDHIVTANSVIIELNNRVGETIDGVGETIDIKGVSFEGEAINGPCKAEGVTNVLSGEKFRVKASGCDIRQSATDKTTIKVILTYAPSSTPDEEKTISGELLTRIT